MTLDRRLEIMDAAYAEIRALAAAKSADYAPGNDTLANFKSGSQTCRLTPFQYLFALVTKQWDAISTAIDANPAYPKTSFESLKDKMRDVVAYMLLLECLLEDLKPEEEDPRGQSIIAELFFPWLRASGGVLKPCEPIIVGEKGPESFVPHSDRPALTVIVGGKGENVALVPGEEYVRAIDGSPVKHLGRRDFGGVELHEFRDMTDGGLFYRHVDDVRDIRHRPEAA